MILVDQHGPVPEYRPDLGPCWLWTRRLSRDGYGTFWDGGSGTLAHRFAYQHFVGLIPDGLELDHLCMVRACCYPAHLEPVTHVENVRRVHAARKSAKITA